MEHRYSKRISANIQTLIYKHGLPVAIGRVRDMSNHGVFIDCAADDVALHQPLEIEFLFEERRAEQSDRFKCFVARKEARGIGLCLFDDYQPAYARCAESILAKHRTSVAISPHRLTAAKCNAFY